MLRLARRSMASCVASSKRMTKSFCRLYLVSPAISDPQAFAPALQAACAAGDVAAVLLRLATGDERAAVNLVKDLAPIVQDAGAALIVAGPAAIAVRGFSKRSVARSA